MRTLLSRLRIDAAILECSAATGMIVLSGYLFGLTAVGRQPGNAVTVLFILLAALCWLRSALRRQIGRHTTKAIAGLAELTAMAFANEMAFADERAGGECHSEDDGPAAATVDRHAAVSAPRRDAVKIRTLFISDVHLGIERCRADLLLECLDGFDAETLFLLGDIVDGRRLESSRYWPRTHGEVAQRLLQMARNGTRLICVAGNHGEFLRDCIGSTFGGIEIVEHAMHRGGDGRDYLVIHSDQFDLVMRHARWLALLGDWGHRVALNLNSCLNAVRRRLGLTHWSLSARATSNIKNAVNYIGRFEELLSAEARRRHVQGVICGHIHHAVMHDEFGVRYINTGDWIESCSAIVEHHDGHFEIVHWLGRDDGRR